MKCPYCDEPTLPFERAAPVVALTAMGLVECRAHLECLARQALGSVGHQRGKCPCFGGTEEDPPGATKRVAALAALLEARRQRAAETHAEVCLDS